MKKYFRFFIVFGLALFMFSCEGRYNAPDKNSQYPDKNSQYYVKYSVKASYPYIFSDVTYADVYGTGSYMNYQTRSWSVTIGPVKKGFRASVRNAKGTATDIIEVSKDGGPFAMKASEKNSASYTINF